MRKENKNIYVTKSFLPPIEEYKRYIDDIWDNPKLTNQGPLLKKFEKKLQDYLDVKNVHFVTNGTIALQLAIRALEVNGSDIITTPFSYVATTSAILWEGCNPVFVDINPDTLCIDVDKIERSITKKTKAILAVHVFGNPCDVEKIEAIAKKHELKVIYDGAHAFGAKYKEKSLLDYGDISICSFHSTKLFHTIEGGCLILRDKNVSNKVELMKRFGHHGDEHYFLGINAKASEFQAAMGLCNFKYLNRIIKKRKEISELYDKLLKGYFKKIKINRDLKHNHAYYPVICKNEREVHKLIKSLNNINVFPRRYFYPPLNTLPYLKKHKSCPNAERISSSIVCLPLYSDLEKSDVKIICRTLKGD